MRQPQLSCLTHPLQSLFVNVRLVHDGVSDTLTSADAEDRAMLESNPSADIGDGVTLGRVT